MPNDRSDPEPPPGEGPAHAGDDPAVSDRAVTSGPPAVPLAPPEACSDEEVRAAAEAARRRDPTAETGQAG
jgi:hypothetical protein